MKKSGYLVCGCVFALLIGQICVTSSFLTEETIFITSYWNTTNYDSGIGLDDWNEAGVVGFTISGYNGNFYVKNDYHYLYIGVLVLGELSDSVTWRINFDIDADRYWAEDAKELQVVEAGLNDFSLNIDDQRYLQGDPIPYSDSQLDDFTAKLRSLEYFDENYILFELTIPLQSDDLLNDLQVVNPEESIIGVSLDVYNLEIGSNGTWKGSSYPNFANSNNYAQIIFAGPQDRKLPVYEDDPPLVTTTDEYTEYTSEEFSESGAGGFELWIGLLGFSSVSYLFYKRRRRT